MAQLLQTPLKSNFSYAQTACKWLEKIAIQCMLWTACCLGAQPTGTSGQIQALAENYNLSAGVAQGQSRIIFYRPVNAPTRGAISILVNEQYHASLIAGGYTFLCVTPGVSELGVRQMDVELRPNKDGIDAISAIDLKSGQTYYLRVEEQQGRRIFLRPVVASQALPELASTRMQIHTVSRVTPVQSCRTAESNPAPYGSSVPSMGYLPAQTGAITAQGYQLAGDTLFAFNRSDRAGLTQGGVMAINRLMSQIRTEYAHIDRIHLIGHADPLGSDYSNERLSMERANTVREYLEMSGQTAGRVTTEGRGSREPVVRGCARVTSAESMACNQPNRRVAVEVTGQRR